jgi:hypothetical protein
VPAPGANVHLADESAGEQSAQVVVEAVRREPDLLRDLRDSARCLEDAEEAIPQRVVERRHDGGVVDLQLLGCGESGRRLLHEWKNIQRLEISPLLRSSSILSFFK